MTVVGGLDDDLRARLIDALRALPAAGATDWPGLVEAHGVVLDLNPENLRLLGMGHAVDVVVGAGDLPGPDHTADRTLMPSAPGAGPDDALDGLRLSHDILGHGVAALKRSRIEFEEARLQAVEAIEEARADLDPFATTAFEQAAAALRRAEQSDEPAPEPTPGESLEDLEAERDRLQAELAELAAIDPTPVADALHEAERASSSEEGLDAVAVQALADALREAEDALTEYDEERREAGRDPVELARRIEATRIQLERLQTSSAPAQISDDDRLELEAAHDAVVDADFKVSTSRIGGKGARQELDKAVEAEQAILDRLGFPTYSAFALAQSAPGPDPETRVELEAARKELAELEAQYREVLAEGSSDRARAALEAERDVFRKDALALVDTEPEHALAALTALAGQLGAADEKVAATTLLRERLEERGVEFAELGLSDDEVLDLARVWLADMQALVDQREDLEHELDTIQARLLVVAPALGQGDQTALDPLTRAQREVEAAEDRLARHRQASDRVAELCGLLEEIEARLADLGENISAQETLVAAAAEGLAAAETRLSEAPDPAEAAAMVEDLLVGMAEDVDETEWFLLTRLAGLRAISYAGSVPLVLDGALAGLEREAAHRVLDKVEAMTDVVQVVYLGEDDAVVEWAALRGPSASVITAATPVG